LIHGSVDVGGGNVTVTFQFARGTFDRSTVVTILLDTDQNPATGFNDTGYGIDYGISLYASTAAFIQRANPSSCASGGNCYTYVPRRLRPTSCRTSLCRPRMSRDWFGA